jgi:hypothetical protein
MCKSFKKDSLKAGLITHYHRSTQIKVKKEEVKLSLCLTKHYAMKAYGEWMYSSMFS